MSGPKPGHGFIVQPRHWVVERTTADASTRHYQVILDAHQGFLVLTQIALLLIRLDLSQLFDTL